MESKNNIVGSLQKRVLGKEKYSETITFIEIMKISGGYSEVMNMPLVAYNQIARGLEQIKKLENKHNKK